MRSAFALRIDSGIIFYLHFSQACGACRGKAPPSANGRPLCRLKAPLGLSLLRKRGLGGIAFFTGGGVAVNCICDSDRPLTIAAPLVKMRLERSAERDKREILK